MYREYPDTFTVAEESTAWPMVSRPIEMGGLGFGMKWNMGWMHDTLAYMKEDPVNRRYHHHKLTFSTVYAFTENFMLPLSHDEVVYGKGSLINKMPGDSWQQFANLRAMYGYMWAHPGKKLLFMGGEFGQRREWTHEGQLEWWVCNMEGHGGVQHMLRELNHVYRAEPSLYELDFSSDGFEWVEPNDEAMSVFAFLRRSSEGAPLLVVCNLTPVPRHNYLLGVPQGGIWRELFNTDAREYGGSGWGNLGAIEAAPVRSHGRAQSLTLNLPPLSTIILKADADAQD